MTTMPASADQPMLAVTTSGGCGRSASSGVRRLACSAGHRQPSSVMPKPMTNASVHDVALKTGALTVSCRNCLAM